MEDAVSTMELVLLKLKNGLTFGDNVFRDGVVSKSVEKSELLSDYKASFFSTVLKGKELRVIGNGESLHEYETLLPDPNALIQCKETDEIYKAACESAEKNDLTICHVPFVDQELNEEGSKMLWKVTKRIWKSLPVNGLLFMVWPGEGPKEMMPSSAYDEG
ncbi:Putative RNA exonuclease NEFsplike [Caligus rogercresseyi]|uniref:RNA exonuclease NEFsplike n=1 Tax=Caligus rogercresseyi TaxID=217165 RepID=A0A7T8H0F2_CALRO|nr:Putative RNA exonuclease NEFsplike [Caligus rogercresseyi]